MRQTHNTDPAFYGDDSVEVDPMTKPSNQPVPHTTPQGPRRPVTPHGTRRGAEPGTKKTLSRSTRLTVDGYRTEDDDPSIVPWGYFEDDDL